MNRLRLCCILLTLAVPGTALAEAICWIDRVLAESPGVRVFFHRESLGGTVVSSNEGVPRRSFGIKEGRVIWMNGDTEAGLLLKPDESASLIMAVENSCTIHFDEQSGHLGITAVASFTIPGANPTAVTKFIRAE